VHLAQPVQQVIRVFGPALRYAQNVPWVTIGCRPATGRLPDRSSDLMLTVPEPE
jgi:hypothetical protein